MSGLNSYNKAQGEKYRSPEAVYDKWIRIHRNINKYTDAATMMESVKEAFTLVECIMKNILADYRTKYEAYGTFVPDSRATYVFHYPTGDITIDFADYSAYGMTKYLRAIGYRLPDEIDETRKLRNFVAHNLETTTVDYFKDNMNYDSTVMALNNLGHCLVSLGMLKPESIMPSFDDLRIKEGDVIGLSDEFNVERFIAKSGTARVYAGTHNRLNRKVAIKELIPKMFSELLIINERDLLVSLRHQRIPNIYDVFNQNGTFYIVMDYVDGVGLDEYLKTHNCTMYEKLKLIYDICEVTNYLHATMGMVHADLKPKNVMVDGNGNVYLIDFGTALDKRNPELVRGFSAGYTAPEVAAGKDIDYRIDIYSIGAIMKYAFAKELADAKTKYSENAEKINRIITRCMEHEPYARYNNVVEIQSEINGIVNNGTVSLGKVAKPKKQRNVFRIILYIVCILVLVGSFGLRFISYLDERKAGKDTNTTESSGSKAAADVSDEEALTAFKELEQKAFEALAEGDEDGYVELFRCNKEGEEMLRETFAANYSSMKDIYNDCDYIVVSNENGICYGCATRTLVSGEGMDARYERREFTYQFTYKEDEWKFDITSPDGIVAESNGLERAYDSLSESFKDAKKSGRNYALLCGQNYLWLDQTLVYEGMVDASVVAASQFADGSVEFIISIKNGMNKAQKINSCKVSLAMASDDEVVNEIVTDYETDINVDINEKTSMLVTVTVPKENVENIAAVWKNVRGEVKVE